MSAAADGRPPVRRVAALPSSLLASAGCALLVAALVAFDARFQHWFVVPVAVCGALAACDALDWLRGRFDIFDPVGLIGLFGVYFFFAAPLLHVAWDRWISSAYWLALVPPPSDWRPWLGWMAWLNALGLLCYRAARAPFLGQRGPRRRWRVWRLAPRRFGPILLIAVALTTLAQVLVFLAFGGFGGFISAFEEQSRDGFAGLGWAFAIAESAPILLLMGVAAELGSRARKPSWTTVILVLLAFFCLRLIFGGLRGSRSNTVWALFWGVGILHLWVRPIPKRLIVAGLAFLLTFMYFYGFYKAVGRDALRAFEGAEVRAELVEDTGRSFEALVLADLGRSDIQAFILYRLSERDAGMRLARGRTYLGALALLVPRSAWPDRPPTKQKEGTELFYGPGSYVPGRWSASKVYGLAGEAMLNFGPLAVPLAFIIFGLLVGFLHRHLRELGRRDARLLIAPFLVNLCIIVLISDSDNILFSLIKNGAVPALILLVGCDRVRYRRATRGG